MLLTRLAEHAAHRGDLAPPYYRYRTVRWLINIRPDGTPAALQLRDQAGSDQPGGKPIPVPYVAVVAGLRAGHDRRGPRTGWRQHVPLRLGWRGDGEQCRAGLRQPSVTGVSSHGAEPGNHCRPPADRYYARAEQGQGCDAGDHPGRSQISERLRSRGDCRLPVGPTPDRSRRGQALTGSGGQHRTTALALFDRNED